MRALVAGLALLFAAPAHAACLAYGPATAELRGTIATGIFPGPPNYRDIATGDQKQTVFLLRLDVAACTKADGEQAAERGFRELQLAFDWASPGSSAVYLEVASGIGSELSLVGELFRGTEREHRTPVLLLVLSQGAD